MFSVDCSAQSLRLQQYPDHLSPDVTIDTSGNKERHVEKESFPTQLYRHIKVHRTPISNISYRRTFVVHLQFGLVIVRVEVKITFLL